MELALWSDYQAQNPEKAAELNDLFAGRLPEGWDQDIPVFEASEKGDATRNSSGKVLNAIAQRVPFMIGGSADLAPSNKSNLTFDGAGDFLPGAFGGRNLHFGIREHAMAGIVNGMSLSGLRSYAATFFVFTDYMRGGMRLSAIMHQPVIYILTHDSIGVGEDGPTHQPIEHLTACRAIPGLYVFRPGDANEVAEAIALRCKSTTHLLLSFSHAKIWKPLIEHRPDPLRDAPRVAMSWMDCEGTPEVILMGSGSELGLCVDAARQLSADDKKVRVVSIPCMELFAAQSPEYLEEVLPSGVTQRVAVEAGLQMSWDRWIGLQGKFVGMSGYGASGPYSEVYKHFGITVDAVVSAANSF